MLKFILVLLCIFLVITSRCQHKVEHVFSLADNPAIIEGMSYDPISKHFYFGESITKRLLRYTLSGKPAGYIDAAKDGMTSVLGSTVDTRNHHLWVCGAVDTGSKQRMCMFRYNLDDGSLIKKLPDTSGKAKLFNDVTITSNGLVFVTDTYTRTIYKSGENFMTEYLRNDLMRDANGITSHNDTLYVSTSRGIVRINTANDSINPLPLPDFMVLGIDGLYYYKNSVIGIQNVIYPVTVVRYHIDNHQNKLSKAELLSVADPSFVIPTTGAMVGDDFYFMSNNNIGNEEFLKTKKGKLKPVTLAKISLTN